MLMAILLLGVASSRAATVTYSLTTHVDGRTITTTANVNSAADIAAAMPNAMKRAYTTYSFYWDAALTQPVAEGDALQGTVYVDYEFNPPFTVSDNNGIEVYYFLTCHSSHGDKGWLHCSSTSENADVAGDYSEGGTSNPFSGDILNGQYDYAIYGDGYALSIKNRYSKKFLYPANATGLFVTETNIKQRTAAYYWQLFDNSNVINGNETCSFGSNVDLFASNSTWFISNNWSGTATAERYQTMNDNGEITSDDVAWWFEESIDNSTNNGMYRYMIYRYNDSDDISLRAATPQNYWSNSTKARSTFMGKTYNSYRDDENYSYRFFKNPDFTNEYGVDSVIVQPTKKGTTLVYVLESPYVSTPWTTLVLPFTISSTEGYFNPNDNANTNVYVNEYNGVVGQLSSNGNSFSCELNFGNTGEILEYKPYLFKAEKVDASLLDWALKVKDLGLDEAVFDDNLVENENSQECTGNAAGIKVTMRGVLAAEGYAMPNDGLHFYFGSVKSGDDYKYGFYRRGATIKPFRCYFFATDERTGEASRMEIDFIENGLTGISHMTVGTPTDGAIYNVNGQKMRSTSTGNLPKGLYIVNGKKIIVK